MSQRGVGGGVGGQICCNTHKALNGQWKQQRVSFFFSFSCLLLALLVLDASASTNKTKPKKKKKTCRLPHPLLCFSCPPPPPFFLMLLASLCLRATLASVRLFLIFHRHTARMPERKPSQLEKCLSPDERLHTRCLHAEPLMTPSRDGARH